MAYINEYSSYVLNKFLDRSMNAKDQKARIMSEKELIWYDTLRKQTKEFNILACELITIDSVLQKMHEPKIRYISVNLWRIVTSLRKQREKILAVKLALTHIRPIGEEEKAIEMFIRQTFTRVAYIRNVVVKENLLLTPIHEYIGLLTDHDFTKDCYRYFGNRPAMFEANTGITNESEDYAMEILGAVHEAGLDEVYKERLEAYIRRTDEITARKNRERQLEQDALDASLMTNGMMAFQRMFNKCFRTLEGNEQIAAGGPTVLDILNRGNRGSNVVLCCYAYRNRPVYRYLGKDGALVPRLKHATIFAEDWRAAEAVKKARQQYPKRIFDTVKIGCA